MNQDFNIQRIVYKYRNNEITIDKIWQMYGADIENLYQTENDIESVVGIIFLTKEMAYYLYQIGYLKNSLEMYHNSITLCVKYRIYNGIFEILLISTANIEFRIESYKNAFKKYRLLIKFFGRKDDYVIGLINSLKGLISKYTTPIYIIVILLWIFELLDSLVFETYIMPTWIGIAGWIIWMLALLCQIVVPAIYKKRIIHFKGNNRLHRQ